MSVLPPKRDSVPLVDPNAVPPGLIPLQELEPISCRNDEILQPPAASRSLSLRCTLRHSWRGIRRAARVFRSRNRSAVVSSAND